MEPSLGPRPGRPAPCGRLPRAKGVVRSAPRGATALPSLPRANRGRRSRLPAAEDDPCGRERQARDGVTRSASSSDRPRGKARNVPRTKQRAPTADRADQGRRPLSPRHAARGRRSRSRPAQRLRRRRRGRPPAPAAGVAAPPRFVPRRRRRGRRRPRRARIRRATAARASRPPARHSRPRVRTSDASRLSRSSSYSRSSALLRNSWRSRYCAPLRLWASSSSSTFASPAL
jgi:hypothetical protein